MKKILWFGSMGIIFMNMLIALIIPTYPLPENILTNFCVFAVLFMLYVVFLEKKTSGIVRTVSIVFGLAGIARLVFQLISLNSFVVNAILAGVTGVIMLIVTLPFIIQKFIKE